MSKNNYVKLFIRIKSNFETTNFLSEKYYNIIEKYYDLKYDYEDDNDESKMLEYELKHYNKLLCSCMYNDYHILDKISDNKGIQYKNKNGFKLLYKKLYKILDKKMPFDDGKITLKDFLYRNRIKLNHSDNPTDEINYIDYYNSIISYSIYDYLFDVLKIEEEIINKIEIKIGKDKIELVKNNPKSNQIIKDNYYKSFKKIINEILVNLKDTDIDTDDYKSIKKKTKILLSDDISINQLQDLIDYLNSIIQKYYLISKVKQKEKSNEYFLLETLFNNNSIIVINMLTELTEVVTKLLNDINANKEEMLNDLYNKKKDFTDTIIKK